MAGWLQGFDCENIENMENQAAISSALRIIDASFNRAMEGLRVVEELARMHLNDAILSQKAKDTRHRLAAIITDAFDSLPLSHRDILRDIGTEIKAAAEYERSDLTQIARANSARVLQSLRSIEEYSKLLQPSIGAAIESVRYEVYAIEKAVVSTLDSRDVLQTALLYVLIDGGSEPAQWRRRVKQLIDAGVDLIQLRDKRLNDRELINVGGQLSELTRGTDTRWIMNDRPDLAAICHADGVHVGQTDLEIADARRIVGSGKLIGVSTHCFEQAEAAVIAGADYIGVGPAFASKTKSFEKFADPQFITDVVTQLSVPAFAIGGINLDNLKDLVQLGVRRIAVSDCVHSAETPAQMVSDLKAMLNSAASGGSSDSVDTKTG